jgi:hypothetical protein
MPARIALGAAAWWEPLVAAALTVASVAGLAVLAGRVYTGAILHTGPTLKLRDAWRNTATPVPSPAQAEARTTTTLLRKARAIAAGRTTMTATDLTSHRLLITVLTAIGVALGVTVAVLTSDVIMGVIAGVAFIAVTTMMVRLWTGHSSPPVAHH